MADAALTGVALNPTETLTGTEAVWSSGTLPLTATAPGTWYLHLLSHNSGGGSGGTLDLGAYYSLDVPILDPEPAYTPGTTNTITWAAVPGATAYYAECDDNADFSSPEFNSGWIADTQYTFTGLAGGTTYYYHVKTRMVIPGATGSWTQTSQTDFISDTLANTSATTVHKALAKRTKGELIDALVGLAGDDRNVLRRIDSRFELEAPPQGTRGRDAPGNCRSDRL